MKKVISVVPVPEVNSLQNLEFINDFYPVHKDSLKWFKFQVDKNASDMDCKVEIRMEPNMDAEKWKRS